MPFWWFTDWYHATAFRGTAAAASTPDATKRRHPSRSVLDADRQLLNAVADALLGDAAVTGGLLDLQVQNGVVILDGHVEDDDTRAAVTDRVWSVPGAP
ncbi:BON domain-containing protein [Actinoplanes xinjiangensis]|uniref:BON domain-containing protein n=1 Tax=Actinoplanes xinjiangensis TaxID=512350 RepID=A0A316EUY5_9ACTN|nr:BON domain-containing protein [Actinoplanes xinjiangensis]PWK36131.1 BON domain-containing protein [Actinoplanes xinjiangensis]GIF42863.1 hypothetical protein Axi01nite_71740 [Actinoplanes xinjiangensis]